MTNDDAIRRYVEAKARAHGWTPEDVIANIYSVDLIDMSFQQWCRTVKDQLIPQLTRIMRQERGRARLQAALLLLYVGEPDGTEGVIACLREENVKFQIDTLSSLSIMPLWPVKVGASAWPQPPAPVKKEALFIALEPFLAEPDTQQGFLAVRVALRLDLPQAESRLVGLMRDGPPRVRSTILSSLAHAGKDLGALDAAEELLRAGEELYSVVGALKDYCKGGEPRYAGRAADLLAEFVRATAGTPGNDVTNYLSDALDGLVAAEHPERERLLKKVLNSRVDDWRRGLALRHLAKLEGEAGIRRLRDALADPKQRRAAARSIAETARDSNDPALVGALATAIGEETREYVLTSLMEALMAVGAGLASLPAEAIARLPPPDAMRLYWVANNITPRVAAERLAKAGVVSLPSEPRLEELEEKWRENRSANAVVVSLLADEQRVAWFDTETSRVPPDYLDLISNFLMISRDVLNAGSFSQEVKEESDDSAIRFVSNGKEYSFTAPDIGGWYDIGAVIQGLNRPLADAGRPERFLQLYTGDQTAAVIFVPEAAFREAADELRMPLASDPMDPIRRGVAYEQSVQSQILRAGEQERRDTRPTLLRRLLSRLSGRAVGKD